MGDGMGPNMFPSSASNVPVEVFELNSPALVRAKEFVTDSAGAGRHRGSPGQRVVMRKAPGHPGNLNIYFHPHRMLFPAQGIFGGGDGRRTRVVLNGTALSDDPEKMTQGYVGLESESDELVVEFPSGGGIYDPGDRNRELVERDVRDGLVSPDAASGIYGAD